MAPQVFTLSEQCTLHSSKVNYATKHFKFRSVRCISMQITGMWNQIIFVTCEWLWFEILESYAIKQFMRLTGMHLAETVCIYNM